MSLNYSRFCFYFAIEIFISNSIFNHVRCKKYVYSMFIIFKGEFVIELDGFLHYCGVLEMKNYPLRIVGFAVGFC
jgi:hypothetical protein